VPPDSLLNLNIIN